MRSFRKLLVVALKPEWVFLKKKFTFQKILPQLYHFETDCALLQTGMGWENAERHFEKCLENFSTKSVLHFGTAGALTEHFKTGEVAKISDITNAAHESLSLDPNPLPHTRPARLYSSKTVLKNKEAKQTIHKKYRTDLVDMESYPIARICQIKGIPYLGIRGVFDAFSDNLENLNNPFNNTGELHPAKLTLNLITRPKLIFTLPRLKKRLEQLQKTWENIITWYLKE